MIEALLGIFLYFYPRCMVKDLVKYKCASIFILTYAYPLIIHVLKKIKHHSTPLCPDRFASSFTPEKDCYRSQVQIQDSRGAF